MSKNVSNEKQERVKPFDTVINFNEDFVPASLVQSNAFVNSFKLRSPKIVPQVTEPPSGVSPSTKNLSPNSSLQLAKMDNIQTLDIVSKTRSYEDESYPGDKADDNLNNRESCVVELRQKLASSVEEVGNISRELLCIKNVKRQFEVRLNELSKHGSMKAETILNLRSKIADLYADNESLQSAHSQAVDHLADLQLQLTELKTSRNWFAEQLRFVETARDRLKAESESLNNSLREGGELNHRLAHENACLQAQLACSRASLADTKRNLTHQLESIRMDIIERETIFERINTERASFESINHQRTDQINQLQADICNLQMELKTTQEQLVDQQTKLRDTDMCLKETENRRNELREKLEHFKQQYHIKKDQLDEEIYKHTAVVEKLKILELDCSDKDLKLNDATVNIATLTASLSVVQQEKDALNDYLTDLKSNLNHVEDSFNQLKHEMDTKCSQIIELKQERDSVSQKVVDLQKQLNEFCTLIDRMKQEKEDLTQTINCLQIENMKFRSGLENLPDKIDAAVQTVVDVLYLQNGNLSRGFDEGGTFQENNEKKLSYCHSCNRATSFDSAYFEHPRSESSTVSLGIDSSDTSLLSNANAYSSPICFTVNNMSNNNINNNLHDPIAPSHSNLQPKNASDLEPVVAVANSHPNIHRPISSLQTTSQTGKFDSVSTGALTVETRSGSARTEQTQSEQFAYHSGGRTSSTSPVNKSNDLQQHIFPAGSVLSSYFTNSENVSDDWNSTNFETSHLIHSDGRTDSEVVYAVPDSSCLADQTTHTNLRTYCSQFTMTELSMTEIDIILSKRDCLNTVKWDDFKRLESERDTLLATVASTNQQLTDTMTDLFTVRKELESKLLIIDNETKARQKAVEMNQKTLAELSATRCQLDELRVKAHDMMLETEGIKNELHVLRSQQNTDHGLHSTELESFKAIIKITTEHLKSVTQSLKQTENEKQALQAELAQLKGGIRGQLEQFRLFTRLDTPDARLLLPNGQTAYSVCSALSALGIDINKLDLLLGEDANLPLLYSKPLRNLDKVFETMQAEIMNLENQVIDHAMCVHDSSGGCGYLENKSANFDEFVDHSSEPVERN